MSLRASTIAFLLTAGVLASTSADAANLAPNLNTRSPALTNAATLAAGRFYGYPSYPVPPAAYPTRPRFTEFETND